MTIASYLFLGGKVKEAKGGKDRCEKGYVGQKGPLERGKRR
jgi:hypothetical protein